MRFEARVNRLALLQACALAAVVAAAPASSATRTWTGGGGDDNWTTAANWGGTAPSGGDDLVFPGGAARLTNSNDFSAGTEFNSISFDGSSGGYQLNGNSIQLAAGISATNTAGTNYVSVNIQLLESQAFSCSTGSPDYLGIFGTVDLGSYTLTLLASPNCIIQAFGAISGTGGVTASGVGGSPLGVVHISGACTYSGPTSVVGNCNLAADNLGAASLVTVTSGSILQGANGSSVGPVVINPGGTIMCGGGVTQIGNVTSLTLMSGSIYWVDLYSLSDHGRFNASGAVDLGSSTLKLVWSFTSSLGDQFLILNKTSPGPVTGTFVGLPEGSRFPSNGRIYQISYVAGDGNDVVITDVTDGEIPALGPTGALLLLVMLGAVGVLSLRNRLSGRGERFSG